MSKRTKKKTVKPVKVSKPVTPCTLLQVIGTDNKEYRSKVFKHDRVDEIIEEGTRLAKELTSPKLMVIRNGITNIELYKYRKDDK